MLVQRTQMDCTSAPEPISGPAVRPMHQMRFLLLSINPSVLQLTTRTSGFNIRCLKDLPGCTDPDGCNYDAGFNIDDGSCDYACNEWVATDGTGACEGAASVTYGDTEYDLVEIGDQCWFRQDLQTTVYQNGDAIATPATSAALAAAAEEPMYIAGEGGHFYNAFVALDERNVCPSGYVAPSNGDLRRSVRTSKPKGGITKRSRPKAAGTVQSAQTNPVSLRFPRVI